MRNSYYHLLGHVLVASHACEESTELRAALRKAGFEDLKAGSQLGHDAESAVRAKIEAVGEDRIREHSVHASAGEVEMWLQTIRMRVKKAVSDESALDLLRAPSLHAHEHTATVVAQAIRTMSMLRCDDRIYEPLGGADPVRELLNRGHALTKKLYKATDMRLAPERTEEGLPAFVALGKLRATMEGWLRDLERAARTVGEKNERLIGRLGLVPDGIGIPVGGTSYAVLLHERGQTDAPDPTNVSVCAGWAAGRQGRNRENLGKGWVTTEA